MNCESVTLDLYERVFKKTSKKILLPKKMNYIASIIPTLINHLEHYFNVMIIRCTSEKKTLIYLMTERFPQISFD